MIFYRIKAFVKKKNLKQAFRRSKAGCSQHDVSHLQRINGETTAPPSPRQSQWCRTHTQTSCLDYTAGWFHCIPFAIWHRHVVVAGDRCCAALVPEVTNNLLDCLFFFPSPSVAKNYLFDDGRQCYPGHRMELEVVAACLLRSHLPQMNCVCVHTSSQVNACLRQCGRWEGFLTTVVRLMPSTELNCCMTTLLFSCHEDFLLLSSMNHH